jgi:hypothetical protein
MKGLFCIEGFWYGDHRDSTSVQPILELVSRYSGLPYLHHRCATAEEFRYSIDRWKTKAFHKKYPILYLAFHGLKGLIKVGKEEITLNELAEMLETKCEGVIIYFGSCETMSLEKRKIQDFMQRTKTLALMGYRKEVDWIKSASFDIQLLSTLIKYPFDSRGVEAIYHELHAESYPLIQELDFRMETNERIWFPRKRKLK